MSSDNPDFLVPLNLPSESQPAPSRKERRAIEKYIEKWGELQPDGSMLIPYGTKEMAMDAEAANLFGREPRAVIDVRCIRCSRHLDYWDLGTPFGGPEAYSPSLREAIADWDVARSLEYFTGCDLYMWPRTATLSDGRRFVEAFEEWHWNEAIPMHALPESGTVTLRCECGHTPQLGLRKVRAELYRLWMQALQEVRPVQVEWSR